MSTYYISYQHELSNGQNVTTFIEDYDWNISWGQSPHYLYYAFFGKKLELEEMGAGTQVVFQIFDKAKDVNNEMSWNSDMCYSSLNQNSPLIRTTRVKELISDYNIANGTSYDTVIIQGQSYLRIEFENNMPGTIKWTPNIQQAYYGRAIQEFKTRTDFIVSYNTLLGEIEFIPNSYYIHIPAENDTYRIVVAEGPTIESCEEVSSYDYVNELSSQQLMSVSTIGNIRTVTLRGYRPIEGNRTLSYNNTNLCVTDGNGNLITSNSSIPVNDKIVIHDPTNAHSALASIINSDNINIKNDCLYEYNNAIDSWALTMPNADITINMSGGTAIRGTLTINVLPIGAGIPTVTVNGATQYYGSPIYIIQNSNVSIDACQTSDYEFDYFEIDNSIFSSENPYSFTMGSSDIIVDIHYKTKHNITTQGTHGSISTVPEDYAVAGTNVIINATPDPNYEINVIQYRYTDDSNQEYIFDVQKNNLGVYTFEMPNYDVTVYVYFVEVYSISIGHNIGAGVLTWMRPDNPTNVPVGSRVTFRVDLTTASSCRVTSDNVNISYDGIHNLWLFTMPNSNIVLDIYYDFYLEVNYDEHCSSITCTNTSTNGNIPGVDNPQTNIVKFEIEENSSIRLDATAETNYEVVGWYADSNYNTLVSSGSSYTINNVTSQISSFVQTQLFVPTKTLALNNVTFGSTTVCSIYSTPNTSQIPVGSTVTLSHVMHDAFEFAQYTGVTVDSNNQFIMPDDNVTISANVYKKVLDNNPSPLNEEITFAFKGKSITLNWPVSIYGRHTGTLI